MTPPGYDGRVVYEGELGLVIGKTCKNASLDEAQAAIFGVTCVNDVTALDVLNRDASFAQWTRAKGCDSFGVFGPMIATGLDLSVLPMRPATVIEVVVDGVGTLRNTFMPEDSAGK